MKDSSYKRYLLATLASVLAFNGVDRLALGIVLQDIKVDLSLSDTQLGLLTGIAFALFYSAMGIPISRWADRGNRVLVITLTTALWSAAVSLCSVATSFTQLMLIRIFVAVGEAGCLPSAFSLLADQFSRAERPRAIAIYLQGSSLSVVIGYALGGWLNQFYGWRITFLWLGLPGVVLVPLAWFTLREPRREQRGRQLSTERASSPPAQANIVTDTAPEFTEVCRTLWRNMTFRHLLLFFSVSSFFNVGIGQWQPAFFLRSFGLKTGETGTWIAAVCGVGVMLGTYLGGEWATRRAANNERGQLRAMAIIYSCVSVFSALIYLSPNPYLAFGLMFLWNVAGTATSGPVFAAIQTLVPERMRATSIALVYLCANLIGLGLGPLAAGALSDAFRPWAGEESLRYSLLALCPGYLWGGWYLWRASRTVTRDLQHAPAQSTAHQTGDDIDVAPAAKIQGTR